MKKDKKLSLKELKITSFITVDMALSIRGGHTGTDNNRDSCHESHCNGNCDITKPITCEQPIEVIH
ncbi:MAG: hypothetical protein WBB45_15060 [Cyclobacteriaceae bacterium]